MRVAVVGIRDPVFLTQLGTRTGDIASDRPRRNTDMVFFLATRVADLRRLERFRATIKSNGAIWVLWRKGRPELKQGDVMAAAKTRGLVDIKVASFSDELSALKLVIPLAARA
jgi:hypothetical protein